MKRELIVSGAIIGLVILVGIEALLNPEPTSTATFLMSLAIIVLLSIEILVMQADIDLLKKINKLRGDR